MFVKIMSDQNLPDSDTKKDYKLLSLGKTGTVIFDEYEKNHVQIIRDGILEVHKMTGNVYIINDLGKTISSKSMV